MPSPPRVAPRGRVFNTHGISRVPSKIATTRAARGTTEASMVGYPITSYSRVMWGYPIGNKLSPNVNWRHLWILEYPKMKNGVPRLKTRFQSRFGPPIQQRKIILLVKVLFIMMQEGIQRSPYSRVPEVPDLSPIMIIYSTS